MGPKIQNIYKTLPVRPLATGVLLIPEITKFRRNFVCFPRIHVPPLAERDHLSYGP